MRIGHLTVVAVSMLASISQLMGEAMHLPAIRYRESLTRRSWHPTTMQHSHIFSLPKACQKEKCQNRAILTLQNSGCSNIMLLEHLHMIKAQCPQQAMGKLEESFRFTSITKDQVIRLAAPVNHFRQDEDKNYSISAQKQARRAFEKTSRLKFSKSTRTACTGDGITVRLTAQRAADCSQRSGKGVTVYVIDTGCRSTHDQLRGRVTTLPAPGSRYRSGEDDHGHGTHVAATIGGRDFGVAPGAKVVCIKALSDRNEGSAHDVVAGIQLAVRMHRAHGGGNNGIVSISLGVRADKRYRVLDRAIGEASRYGLVPVVAAGNSGRDACTFTPARAAAAITVAATGKDGRVARFSNWGKCVTVGAPGVRVWSAVASGDDAYGVSSGTSMAAPFVSGVAALVMGERRRVGSGAVARWLREIGLDTADGGVSVVSVAGFCRWAAQVR